MEDILALILIPGGVVAVCLAFSPIGRALAVQERVDFAERLLAQRTEPNRLPVS
jgi:hypothetical protein